MRPLRTLVAVGAATERAAAGQVALGPDAARAAPAPAATVSAEPWPHRRRSLATRNATCTLAVRHIVSERACRTWASGHATADDVAEAYHLPGCRASGARRRRNCDARGQQTRRRLNRCRSSDAPIVTSELLRARPPLISADLPAPVKTALATRVHDGWLPVQLCHPATLEHRIYREGPQQRGAAHVWRRTGWASQALEVTGRFGQAFDAFCTWPDLSRTPRARDAEERRPHTARDRRVHRRQ
jgi:hypothetical protein